MTIQAIISRTVKRLQAEGKLLTPDIYQETFCQEAKKANVIIEDCQHLQMLQQLLNPEFQKDLEDYNVKTMHEFVRFLIATLNRTHPAHPAPPPKQPNSCKQPSTRDQALNKFLKSNFSLAIFDIDSFTTLQKDFSHGARDAVVSAVTKILQQECRSVDSVGEFGDGVFIAVLYERDATSAATLAKRVCQHVAKARFMYKGERLAVTMHAGVAQRADYSSLAATLSGADAALERAKSLC